MIARYSLPAMESVWSDRTRYDLWLRIELEVARALGEEGVFPKDETERLISLCEAILRDGGLDPAKILEVERTTRHDVIAFTTVLAEAVRERDTNLSTRAIHFGLTSSDVLDTALALQLREALELVLIALGSVRERLWLEAQKYKTLPTVGRSHGMFAEPTSFGLKILGHWCEFSRVERALEDAKESISFGKLSGAVGVSPHWGPEFEEKVLGRLALRREPVATQVVPRDRVMAVMQVLSRVGAAIERLAIEVRHLQRTEVGELREGFAPGQKGSSAMPHKRNPISSENLTGVARMLRGYEHMALENGALWHERDISHSSVERVAVPDAFLLSHYALDRLSAMIRDWVVDEERIRARAREAQKNTFSGHVLLELVRAGASREDAYYWVQEAALKVEQDRSLSFEDELSRHPEVQKRIKRDSLRGIGTLEYQLRHVESLFREAEKAYTKTSVPLRRS